MSEANLPEQRADHGALLILVQQVHEGQQALDRKLTEHMRDETQDLADAVATILNKAFPDGDADGHRRAHEAQIAAMEARAQFWQKVAFEITKYGLIGFFGWLVIVAWKAIVLGPVK